MLEYNLSVSIINLRLLQYLRFVCLMNFLTQNILKHILISYFPQKQVLVFTYVFLEDNLLEMANNLEKKKRNVINLFSFEFVIC